ncbi:unnamed protein product [Tenebrio molitor]|nr:unnamed protein product [Tenebrio molitor]
MATQFVERNSDDLLRFANIVIYTWQHWRIIFFYRLSFDCDN